VPSGYVRPTAAFTIQRRQVISVAPVGTAPTVDDVMYDGVERIGLLATLENRSGRIHPIEWALDAVADLLPRPHYVIAGADHPKARLEDASAVATFAADPDAGRTSPIDVLTIVAR
jgi:hypothetical protein